MYFLSMPVCLCLVLFLCLVVYIWFWFGRCELSPPLQLILERFVCKISFYASNVALNAADPFTFAVLFMLVQLMRC